MAKPENQFIAGVHKYLDPKVYHMKNHNAYNGGIFDVWYSAKPFDLWVEYKFIEIPKRPKTSIMPDLSALQLEWGKARKEEGRNCWVIIGAKEGGVVLRDQAMWDAAITAEAFRSALLTRKEIAQLITEFVAP